MQLALIVQLSIALMAQQLGGALPLGPWAGAAIALCGPLAALILGHVSARRALGRMDRREAGAAERFFAFNARMGWIVAVFLFAAASTTLPTAFTGGFGGLLVGAFLLGCGIAGSLVASWNGWLVESRIREATIIGTLDKSRPLHEFPARGSYVLAQARAGLAPALLPLLVPIALSALAQWGARVYAPEHESVAELGGAVLGVLVLLLLIPVLIPPLLGLRRLAPGEMRDDLAHLASTAGIGVREIWVWPTDGLVANAAVMGVFPGLRCVMLSDALLECMPREQVRAVMAHELGHVARKHLAWMLPVLLACWILGALIADPAVRAIYQAFADAANRGDFGDASMSELQSIVQTLALFRDAAIVVLGLVIFGFVSRRFERQADAYAVRLLSVESGTAAMSAAAVSAMTGALTSVAFLNHVPVDRPSWRHGSILWRQRYLHSLSGAPVGPLGIDRFVTAMCLVALALVAYLVVAFVLGSA